MKPSIVLSIALAGSVAVGSAAAAESAARAPKDAYDTDVVCAAVATAAQTHDLRGTSKTADDPRVADTLQAYYAKRAVVSGAEAGIAPEKVPQDIDTFERSIARRLDGADPAVARSEKTDTGRMLQNCAALPIFETGQRLAR